jgi:nucleotidyltransferase substrate binding protein (TIGR01987 family)
MSSPDIRWKQRFSNFQNAFKQLSTAVELFRSRALSELESQGLIKAFEFSYELAWNLLKDYLEYQGITSMIGSRDATREAFQKGLIKNGEVWMEMIRSRNQTAHIYDEKVSAKIIFDITTSYYAEFQGLDEKMSELLKDAP